MRKSTIVFVEFGMLGGIIVAFYTLPNSTPLAAFLFASGACLLVGNLLLLRRMKQTGGRKNSNTSGAWPHLLRAFAVLAVAWLLLWLMYRK